MEDKLEKVCRQNLQLQQELQLEKEKNKKVPTAITAEVIEVTTVLTMSTGSKSKKKLTVAQQNALLDDPEVASEIQEKLFRYISNQIFKNAKFVMTRSREWEVCLSAVARKKVELPDGVTKDVFVEKCHSLVQKRMNSLQNNCHSSCKGKFDSKFG